MHNFEEVCRAFLALVEKGALRTIYYYYPYFSNIAQKNTPYIEYDHNNRLYNFSEANMMEFIEDNPHMYSLINVSPEEMGDYLPDLHKERSSHEDRLVIGHCCLIRDVMSRHLQYFNFLHHIQDIINIMPLYTSNGSTFELYKPAKPPRVFSALFKREGEAYDLKRDPLNDLWATQENELSKLFAFNIFSPELGEYNLNEFNYVKNCWNPKFLATTKHWTGKTEDFVRNTLIDNGYLYKGEVWLAHKGILYPITLQLTAQILDASVQDAYFHFFSFLSHFKSGIRELSLSSS